MIPAKYWSPTKRLMLLGAMAGGKAVEDTATGNPLSFLTDLAKPLKSLLIPFTPIQEGSGDPSPVNVRPIVPFTGCDILRMGVNLWDEEWEIGSINNDTGQNTPSDNTLRSKNYSPCIPGERYFVYHRLNGSDMRLHWYRKDKTFISSSWRNIGSFVAPDDAYYFRFRMASSYGTEYKYDIGINYPYTRTGYKAYTGNNVYSVMFPSPVYGGVLDAVTGVLTVDKAYQLLNDADKWVQLTAGQTVDFSYEQDFERKLYDGSLTGLTCSAFLAVVNQNVAYCRWRGATSLKFGIKNGNSMATPLSLADVKQMATNGEIAICYDIEPQTVQLTGEQITALVGDNTLWSDANGDMTAVYLKKA